jgi:hypothetical protein
MKPLSALELSSAFDVTQTRDEQLPPSRNRRLAGKIRQMLSRKSVTKNGNEFFYLHPYCTLQNSKPLM